MNGFLKALLQALLQGYTEEVGRRENTYYL